MLSLHLLPTIEYSLNKNHVGEALDMVREHVEELTEYIDVDRILDRMGADNALTQAQWLTLSKMCLLSKYYSQCVHCALNASSELFNEPVEFYRSSILYKIFSELSSKIKEGCSDGDRLLSFVLQFISKEKPSLSLIGYLVEIREYSLACKTFEELLGSIDGDSSNGIVELLDTVSHHPVHKQFLKILSESNVIYTSSTSSIRLLYLILDNMKAEDQIEYLEKLPYPLNAYGATYIYNSSDRGEGLSSGSSIVGYCLDGNINRPLTAFMAGSINMKLLDSMAKYSTNFYLCNSIFHAHTTNDTLYRSNNISTVSWNIFLELGGLGIIHGSNGIKLLRETLPTNLQNVTIEQSVGLFVLGLIGSNCRMYGEGEIEYREYITSLLNITGRNTDSNAASLSCYANFGLFMSYSLLFFKSSILPSSIRTLFSEYSTLSQETAAYATALIYYGTGNEEIIEYLEQLRDTTEFTRAKRAMNMAIGFVTSCSSTSEIGDDGDINSITSYLYHIASSYCDTSDLGIISNVLELISHPDENIQRLASITICSVAGYNKKIIETIIFPLMKNHSKFVRSSVAVCIGLFHTHSEPAANGIDNIPLVYQILENAMDDSDDLVKQAGFIGMGMQLIQYNELDHTTTSFYNRILSIFNTAISNRHSPKCVKIGASIGRAICDLSCKKSILSINNILGRREDKRVMGFLLFMDSWYFNPMYLMLSLLVTPTPIYKYKVKGDAPSTDSVVDSGSPLALVENTGIATDYSEISVLFSETKKNRKFKDKSTVNVENEVVKVKGELRSGEKWNYSERCGRGPFIFE